MGNTIFSSFQVPQCWPWGGTIGEARFYCSSDFTDENGVLHLAGEEASLESFWRIAFSISADTISFDGFEIPPTETSIDQPQVRVTCCLFDSTGLFKKKLFSDYVIPADSPTTWLKFLEANVARPQRLAPRYGTWDMIVGLFNTIVDGAQKASESLFGVVKLSVAPAVAGEPKAVGDNDPRVPTTDQAAAFAGTNGSPSVSNKFVTDSDPRLTSASTLTLTPVLFAALGTPANGTIKFCSDALESSDPAAGSGSGSFVLRINGRWRSL